MSRISSARNELADQYRTQQAELDEMKDDHEKEVSQLKKNYSTEKASLEDRFEKSLQEDRLAHYDHLRDTKRQMQREERDLENRRKEVVDGHQHELYREQLQTEQDGRSHLNQLKQKYAAAEEYERNRAIAAQEEVRTHHKQTAESILSESNKRIQNLRDQKTAELETQKATHAKAVDQIRSHYDGLRTNVENQYAAGVANLESRAGAELDSRKRADMNVLKNYSERSHDPFYHLNRFDSDLRDDGDAYVLRVKVPPYERPQFQVHVSGQELHLTGTRSFQEKVETEPGRWVSTHSYQNVSEKVPLDVPVDGRSMTVQSDGDWVEYTIPKFSQHRRINDTYRPQPVASLDEQDREMARELNFGKNLPRPKESV